MPTGPAFNRARWFGAGLLGATFVVALSALSLCGRVPLTYDEAFNVTEIASRGVGYVVTHYPNPNNHVAFTALQALLLPESGVKAWPLALRIPNLVAGAGLLLLLTLILSRRESPAVAVLIAVSALLSAPLFTTYLLVARGYLLGTLLLLASLVWTAGERTSLGTAALLALATWTVPTFAYAVPGVLAASIAGRKEERRAVAPGIAGLVYLALVLLLYAPVLREMLAQRQSWRGFAPPGRFSLGVVLRLTNLPSAVPGTVALLLAGGAALFSRRQQDAFRDRLLLLMLGALASFLILAEALAGLGFAGTPFWRYLLFAPLFLVLALGLALPALPRAARVLLFALLLANAALGLSDLEASFLQGNPAAYRGFRALGPTGVERALLAGTPFSDVRCDSLAAAVCGAYAARLPGLSLGPLEAENLPCLAGGSPPPDGLGIAVSARGGRRQLCY
jgi:hypothetical protein